MKMINIFVNNNTCKALGLMMSLKSRAPYSGTKRQKSRTILSEIKPSIHQLSL